MRFIRVNLSRVIFSFVLIVFTFNVNFVFAGGDPAIKDEKVIVNKTISLSTNTKKLILIKIQKIILNQT